MRSPSDAPYTAAARPAGPAPTTMRSKPPSGMVPTVSPRYSASTPGVGRRSTLPETMTTGKSRGVISNSRSRRSTSVSASGSNHSCGIRLRTRNSRTWPESGENREPMTRIAEEAPVKRIARRARKAARILSLRPASVAITSPERITRNGEHFAGLGDSRRHEHPLTGQQIQLAEESAGRVAGDDAFLPVGVDDDLDGARKDDVEIVAGVALPVQVFTGRHRPANAKRLQRRQLRVVQLPEGIIGLSRQGSLNLSPFERSATRPAPQRCPRARVRTTTLPEACGESVSRAPSSCIAM